ncbi:MAG: RDD family protein [Clostridiales bacterium]|jgi:uncharacterized RDD family membrane protein YckC|nr:RDD family protein [Clostridiales bacterium]
MKAAMRVLAQFIDIILYFVIMAVLLLFVAPLLTRIVGSLTAALLTFSLSVIIYFAMQYPFYTNLQTIGKAFFGLYIKPPVGILTSNFTLVFIREIFIKLMSLYIACLPVLWGGKGVHEKATKTEVIMKIKRKANG